MRKGSGKKYNYKGKLYTVRELADIAGVPIYIIRSRLRQFNGNIERVVKTKYKPKNIKKISNNEFMGKSLDEIYESSLKKRPIDLYI